MNNLLSNLYTGDKVNTDRQREIDFAKAVIIFCLAFVHITIECCTDEQLCTGVPYLFDSVIGGPFGASVFMLSMGAGIIYTTKNSAHDLFKRGIAIAIAGYLLNFLRFLLPFFIGYQISGDYNQYIDPMWYRFFGNDILQFAPLAFFMFALFAKFGIKKVWMFVIALSMNIVGQFFNGIDLGSPVLNTAFGYLVGTEDAAGKVFSDFPLLNWFIIPVVGYLFADLLIRMSDQVKNRWYAITAPIVIVFVAIYLYIGITREIGMYGEGQNCYYHVSTPDVFCCMGCAYSLVCVGYYISKFSPAWFDKILYIISSNITRVYCIHWVLISFIVRLWIYCKTGTQLIPYSYAMLLSLVVSIVSIIVAENYKRYIKRGAKRNCR